MEKSTKTNGSNVSKEKNKKQKNGGCLTIILIVLIVLLLLLIIFVFIALSSTTGNVGKVERSESTVRNNQIEVNENSDSFENQEESNNDEMTMGQQNALRKAQNYLDTMAFSRTGLIGQLEFEGYSNEDATYAVDNCGANWSSQAVKCAQNYLDTMAFSREGLIEQLQFDGFTYEEAVYGVEQNGY